MNKTTISIHNFFLTVCLTLFTVLLSAQNPILKGYADPHLKIWNGRMYISVGKDKSPEIKEFSMPYWSIFSSSDLLNWKPETNIDPMDTYLGPGYNACWVSDISENSGKYYFYFSNGGKATGALVAEKPEGPYMDVLKKPFIPEEFSVNHEYDLTLFRDDDGKQYSTLSSLRNYKRSKVSQIRRSV